MQSDYQFEPVHIDWSGLRTQMIIGLLTIFCLCLINFISFRQCQFWDTAYGSWSDFTLYFASCSLVALITLAICKNFGNRNGACCAIWSALIFAVTSGQIITSSSTTRTDWMISFFILLSALMLLASKEKKSKILSWLTLILVFCTSIYYGGNYNFSLAALKQLFLPLQTGVCGPNNVYIVLTGYVLIVLTFVSRIVLRALSWQGASKVFFILLSAIFFAFASASSNLAGTGFLAITFSLACLPGIGATTASTNQLYGSLGTIALTFMAITLEHLLCIQAFNQ